MTTSDKELLELAAKAEGHGVEYDEVSGLFWYDNIYTGLLWNPLHNDGDAMRLAVKLKILVVVNKFSSSATDGSFDMESTETYHEDFKDPYAATRRAIVRAAAEIGEKL